MCLNEKTQRERILRQLSAYADELEAINFHTESSFLGKLSDHVKEVPEISVDDLLEWIFDNVVEDS